jgi:transcriptional regulator with XRE-family HTH domain
MKKTSIYLEEADVERLRRLAELEGRSQAEIVRAAIAAYEANLKPNRNFALTASWAGDGMSIADIPEEELLKGFGEPEILEESRG